MKPFLLALQFLTIITIKSDLRAGERDMARSMAFYPLVGLMVGFILAATHWVFQHVWPPLVVDFLTVLALIIMTRGLHLDGLADTLDGILGGSNREQCLEIMKDSRVGAFGVIGIISVLLVKFLALTGIPSYLKIHVLIVLPMFSRYSMVQLAYRTPYARRQGGLGSPLQDALRPREIIAALATTVAAAYLILGVRGLFCLVLLMVLTFCYRALFKWKLGGVTGDVYGFVNEWNEAFLLLAISAMAGFPFNP